MRDMQHIARAVKDTLSCDFGRVIADVRVQDEVGWDGDALLRVDVVFEGTHEDIDARRLNGAVRNVRLRLRDMKEDAFPLFSFISKGDWGAERRKSA